MSISIITTPKEYVISKKAGVKDIHTFYKDLESHINAVENSPGRFHQSLAQASYNTWKDGPFGTMSLEEGKTISYYDKGSIVGLFLDLAIRQATQSKASLNDVMYQLYHTYYKGKGRGFTEAEFQFMCEKIAKTPLTEFFEYVYSTKKLDYQKYLGYAGLRLDTIKTKDGQNNKKTFKIKPLSDPTHAELSLREAWINQ